MSVAGGEVVFFTRYALIFGVHCTVQCTSTDDTAFTSRENTEDSLRIALVVLGLSIVALGTMCLPTGQTDTGVLR